MKIALDFGHGFGDSGAIGNGKREDLIVREIGERVKTYLDKENHQTKIVSLDGGLTSRTNLANKWGADLYVSIHMNSNSGTPATGTEVYVYNSTSKAKPFAERIVNNISGLGYKNRGVKTANFAVLRGSSMPALLIECCFINNSDDMNKLNFDKMALAISEGILNKKINNTPAAEKPDTIQPEGVYRVICGSYKDKQNALNIQKQLQEKGFPSFLEFKK